MHMYILNVWLCVYVIHMCIIQSFCSSVLIYIQENKRLADIVARANQSETHEQDLGWDDEDEEDTRGRMTYERCYKRGVHFWELYCT